MNRLIPIALGVLMAAGTGIQGASQPTQGQRYSKSEIQQMIRAAHTPQEYQALAEYFRSEQQAFESKALVEKAEWDRRSQNVTGPLAKYPRPVDSSRNRYEYFAYEAQQMGQQADHFENLSGKTQQ